MFEKVNPKHPDKIADRIAGAIVDLAYKREENPRVAVEVLLGHNVAHVMAETSVHFTAAEVKDIVRRITDGEVAVVCYHEAPQDAHLAENQRDGFRCGDNGIFRGAPVTEEQKKLAEIARDIYGRYDADGKYILNGDRLIICQSNAEAEEIAEQYTTAEINPLGNWTGGLDVDAGATNRKLGSDMADSITGGGLHGKDLSKADISVNIWAWLEAQRTGEAVEYVCAIGDREINGTPYSEIVETARAYIEDIGGFEKFAEWGLI